MKKTNKQRGAVSLFVVIFAALLITVVTVSFIRIMILNQQQATANDLSQSAYDSAQAGVEDGKRAVLSFMSKCSSGDTITCNQDTIDKYASTCNIAIQSLSDYSTMSGSDKEVPVQTGSVSLNQAYTCVTVKLLTDEYIGYLGKDESSVIPLVGVTDFNTVKIEWFNDSDLRGDSTSTGIDYPSNSGTGTPLLSEASWTGTTSSTAKQNIPSIMRTQLIQFHKTEIGFNLTDFDSISSDNAPNSTLFLYPASAGTTVAFAENIRLTKDNPGAPSLETCPKNITPGGYACSAILTLPRTVGADYGAYLNLKSLYKGSHYRITLSNSTTGPVQFDKVQPVIDSTGRADDLFRRVQSRVSLINVNFPYPNGEIQVKGNLCKDSIVTNLESDFTQFNTGLCDPSL